LESGNGTTGRCHPDKGEDPADKQIEEDGYQDCYDQQFEQREAFGAARTKAVEQGLHIRKSSEKREVRHVAMGGGPSQLPMVVEFEEKNGEPEGPEVGLGIQRQRVLGRSRYWYSYPMGNRLCLGFDHRPGRCATR